MRKGLKPFVADCIRFGPIEAVQRQLDFYWLDFRYNIDLGDEVKSSDPGKSMYCAASRITLKRVLKKIPVDPSKTVFLDLGCGKGLPLIVAGMMGFYKLVGVEIDRSLSNICIQNLKKCKLWNNAYVYTDDILKVLPYLIPPLIYHPIIYFMYNSVGGHELRTILTHIKKTKHKSPYYMIYFNAIYDTIFDDLGYTIFYEENKRYGYHYSRGLRVYRWLP